MSDALLFHSSYSEVCFLGSNVPCYLDSHVTPLCEEQTPAHLPSLPVTFCHTKFLCYLGHSSIHHPVHKAFLQLCLLCLELIHYCESKAL